MPKSIRFCFAPIFAFFAVLGTLLYSLPAAARPSALHPPDQHFLGYTATFLPKSASLSPFLRGVDTQWAQLKKEDYKELYIPPLPEGTMPPKAAHAWKRVYAQLQKAKALDILRGVNGFFNKVPSKDDIRLYKKKEYWASPREFFAHWGGDCEDYVFAKYFALKALHWPKHELWPLLVYDLEHNLPHAVLAVRHEGKTYILDNLAKPRHKLLDEKDYKNKMLPLLALTHQGVWIFEKSFTNYMNKYYKEEKTQ